MSILASSSMESWLRLVAAAPPVTRGVATADPAQADARMTAHRPVRARRSARPSAAGPPRTLAMFGPSPEAAGRSLSRCFNLEVYTPLILSRVAHSAGEWIARP